MAQFFPMILWNINTAIILQPPSSTHFFGTDSLGRDVFSRVIAAIPIDAEVPFAVLTIAVLGLATGTFPGYAGGIIEEVLMRVTDIFLAIPGIVLALAIAAALGPGVNNSILVSKSRVFWPQSYWRPGVQSHLP